MVDGSTLWDLFAVSVAVWSCAWGAVCLLRVFLKRQLLPKRLRRMLIIAPLLFGLAHASAIVWFGLPQTRLVWAYVHVGVSAALPVFAGLLASGQLFLIELAVCQAIRGSGTPMCPKCGYVLYYAENSRCPECGRFFCISEMDMSSAEVDAAGVLRPKRSEDLGNRHDSEQGKKHQ